MPVLVCTDPNTDIGKVVVNGGFGWWCESDDSTMFVQLLQNVLMDDLQSKRNNAFSYLQKHYSVSVCYNTIIKHMKAN